MAKEKKVGVSKGGRPLANLNEGQILELAKLHCTYKEIAAVMDCSVDTLERRFADLINKGKEQGKKTLRKWQWDLAAKGNLGMLVWLGKQWLGQRDKAEDEAQQIIFNVQVNEIPK